MAWEAIVAADVEAALSGPELAAFRTKAGAANGTDDDKLADIIATVTDEVRGHIEDCSKNRVGAAGTLPARLKHHAVAVIRYRLLNRLGVQISDGRKQEYEDARRCFERVSECKFTIEQPDSEDVVTEANTPEIETINTPTANRTRTKLDGLY